jgi:hypothetical protein
MHCERCHQTITEQTVRLYRGRCVPCHRTRFLPMLSRLFKDTLSLIGLIFSTPFHLLCDFPRIIRLWLTPLPFNRKEVTTAMAPIHGDAAAKMYFNGLRQGFLEGTGMSGHYFFTLGMHDGATLRYDISQWPAILQSRATKPIKVN